MPFQTESTPRRPPARLSALAALAAVGALVLAACAPLPPAEPEPAPAPPPAPASAPPVVMVEPAPPPPPPQPDPQQLEDGATRQLLAWQERQRGLAGADLAREIALREPPVGANATLELALLLAQRAASTATAAAGTAPNGDLARALVLIDPVARGTAPERAVARLLQARLADQRRLEEQIERQGQQLREQQRRLEQLAAQLEALRAIERSLSGSRPGGPPTPAAPAPAASR